MVKNGIINFLAFFGFTIVSLHAQETRFFMPLEIKKAYEKGTRSYDGKPGANYWDNTVDYDIKVKLIPSEKLIDGYEEVVYYNNSPNDINYLSVRLYGDAYKKGVPRAKDIDAEDINDGVELTNVIIDGVTYDIKNTKIVRRKGTNIRFKLEKPLKSGSKLTFKASWKQKIPSYSIYRTGAYDSTSFFIAYWYPQISVYDDIFGWDRLDYSLRTEFYNNLGNYDVEITTPNNYIVWATGTLENSKKVLPRSIYNKYIKAKSSKKVVHVLTASNLKKGIKLPTNTWHYTASQVSDFAFALSSQYLWDAAMQQVENKNVLINSVYPIDTINDYSNLVPIQQKAIQHFSEDIPGIPYPYEAFTTFINDYKGGMEYPMMANNIGPYKGVTIHEMLHTYLPMYVRTNECRWAWMDEGWARYTTSLVSNHFFQDTFDITEVFYDVNPNYMGVLGTSSDLPLITSSQFLTGSNYYYESYLMSSSVYAIIHQYLGDEVYIKCCQEFIKRWALKSPTPYDYFYTFENISGQDLGWIWKPWFFEFGIPDVAIKSFQDNKLTVINQGNKPVPLLIEINYKNGESKHLIENAGIWADSNKEYEIIIPDEKDIALISVNRTVADVNLIDNIVPTIQSFYETFNVSDDILGQYLLVKYATTVNITKEDGLFYFSMSDFGFSDIIFPIDENKFRYLGNSGVIKINVDDSGNCNSIEFYVDSSKVKAIKLKE